MVDIYTLQKQQLDTKHAELITIAKSFVDWGLENDSPSSYDIVRHKPTSSSELMLWGKFYTQNALGDAFSKAYQEYEELTRRCMLSAP